MFLLFDAAPEPFVPDMAGASVWGTVGIVAGIVTLVLVAVAIIVAIVSTKKKK